MRIIFLWGSLLFVSCSIPKTTTTTIKELSNTIAVPFTINGRTYNFIWDTGCTTSGISQKVSEECGLTATGDSTSVAVYLTQTKSKYAITSVAKYSVGDIVSHHQFILYDDIMPYVPNKLLKDTVHGIIGADMINNFNWMFDLEQRNVVVSDRSIAVEQSPQLTLSFTISSTGSPECSVVLNDSMKVRLMFDSGMSGANMIYNDEVSPVNLGYDMMIATSDVSRSVWPYFYNVQKKIKLIKVEGQDLEIGRVIDFLKINNFGPIKSYIKLDVSDFSKHIEDDGLQGYITAHFMRRFGKMYYNPFAKQIHFYESTIWRKNHASKAMEELFGD